MKEWHDKLEEWSGSRLTDYINWVRETYGNEEANKLFTYADSYRAVKDTMPDEESSYNFGWHDPRGIYESK